MIRLAFLKRRVIDNLIVPSSVTTLALVIKRPEWQVKYALDSLVAAKVVEPSGRLFRMCEPRSRARSQS